MSAKHFAALRQIKLFLKHYVLTEKVLAGLEEEGTVHVAQANSKAPSNATGTGLSPPCGKQAKSVSFCLVKSVTSNSHIELVVTEWPELCKWQFCKGRFRRTNWKIQLANTNKNSLQGRKKPIWTDAEFRKCNYTALYNANVLTYKVS